MVSILATEHEVQLVESIPNTKVVKGKLAFGDQFEAALIRYIVKAKKIPESEPVAIRLEESLGKLIERLKEDDKSKPIGERLEKGIRGDGISNSEENLVNGDIVQPVQRSSSHEEVIDKHVISFTPAPDVHVAAALELLRNVGLDKVEKDIFSSNEFMLWSKQIAEKYRAEPREGVRVMWTTLAKHDLEKLKKSISDTEVVDGKLAFGDRFKDSLIDYIAIAEDVEDLQSFAIHLEDSLFSLCRKLVKGKTIEGLRSPVMVLL
ncbi:hypothetical protein Plhal703r1_c59g0164121 [Plasmopara halstedii]